jgi:DNA-binding PadR family transcriptional regulator
MHHHHHWNPFDRGDVREPFDLAGRGGGGRRGGRERGGAPGHGHGGPFGFGGPPGGFAPGPLGFFNLFRRGPRARRGDIRSAILVLLAEQSRNGYQIMQELEQRSRGVWRPSPGAVYPALQLLEDEGLIAADTSGSGRTFALTDKGREEATAQTDENEAPWESVSDSAGSDIPEMFHLMKHVGAAAIQVAQTGSAAQVAEARKILAQTRKALYRLLADEDPDAKSE